jgi:four helix bundle protein
MAFDALETAIQLATALRSPLTRLRQHDRELATQAIRACNSVALNLDEGRRRAGRDRLQLFHVALGSAGELQTALRLATAWGHLVPADLAAPHALLDRILAMTWRLCHRR